MKRIGSSFRDPDGFIFEFKGEIFRAVNISYKTDYDFLLSSGLYKKLVDLEMIIPFEEVDQTDMGLSGYYKILKPEPINFISYPYEWSLNMLKDAALLTLKIQKIALEYGMSLKDASAFNVQFRKGKPVFIDTLSFELYPVYRPWLAYRQFCQHFLAPLALMTYVDPGLNKLFIIHIDGVPLDLAIRMLPFKCRFNLGLFLHLFVHAKFQRKHKKSKNPRSLSERKFSLAAMYNLLEGLRTTIENQVWDPKGTEWINYNDKDVHIEEYINFKKTLISQWLDEIKPESIWDLGANTGDYSQLAAGKGIDVIAFDSDPACIEKNYSKIRKSGETHILPLLIDLLNVSPSIGWRVEERLSLFKRTKPEMIMALAIIHHLVIRANSSFESISSFFAELTDKLIIEFIPKEDEKVQLLLNNRKDIFSKYTQADFEQAFLQYYIISRRKYCTCNKRVFYFMIKK